MEIRTTQTTTSENLREFELRHHQIYIERADELKVTDLLKDTDEEGIAISKADLILIFTIYDDGIKEFFRLYKNYIEECKQRRWRAVDKPHWFLKRNCD